MKKLTAILLIVMLALSFAACGGGSKPSGADDGGNKTETDPFEGLTKYETSVGLNIYMEAGLSESTVENFDLYLGGDYCAMTAIIDSKDDFSAAGINFDISLEEYSTYIVAANELEGEFVKDEYGNVAIEYEKTIDGSDFYYYCVLKKSDDAFWAITFMSMAADKDEYSSAFPLWGSSISF